MFDYLKNQYHYGLSEEEKNEMEELIKELKKYKEMDLVAKSNSNSGSNSGSEDNYYKRENRSS